MLEVIQKVKVTEENAEELRKTCRRTVAEIKDSATAVGKQTLEEQTRKAAEESAALIKRAEDEAAVYLAEARGKSQTICDEAVAAARRNMGRAADFIVERIVSAL